MLQPSVANGGSPTTPTTTYYYDSDGNLTSETLPNGTQETLTYYYDVDPTSGGGKIDLLQSFTQTAGTQPSEETVYTYNLSNGDDSNGDLLSVEKYANGANYPDPAIDPITSYAYTPYTGNSSTPPAGLVSSVINPVGDVTAYTYDPAGNPLTTSQGQTVTPSFNTATFANLPLSPGQTRTYTIYVQSSVAPTGSGSGNSNGGGYTITDPGNSATPTYYADCATTLFGSSNPWYELATVTLAATDASSALTVNCPSTAGASQVAFLEQTSATVYDNQENPLSLTDALGRVTASTYDNLGRPLATSQGQTVSVVSGAAAFQNLPQSSGLTRTYTVYVQSSVAPHQRQRLHDLGKRHGQSHAELRRFFHDTLGQRLVFAGYGHARRHRREFHADRQLLGLGHRFAGLFARADLGHRLRRR